MNKEQKIQAVRDYCEWDLRDGSQTDNLYFGTDKNGKCQGSIYWVEGATTWLYYCNGKSKYGQCGDLLYGMKKKILLSYYEDNKEEINDWLEDNKEAEKNAELKELKEFKTAIIEEGKL